MEKRVSDLSALEAEAQALLARLAPREHATLVTLSGELGAGKTTFTQAVARALGVTETVTSPTFVLEKLYLLPEGSAWKRLAHIDAYRLDGGNALNALGFTELMQNPGTLVLLEWPEKVADGLPQPDVSITLTPKPDGSRLISYA